MVIYVLPFPMIAMNDATLVMGIDGGGSKTQVCIAVIGDQSSDRRIVGRGMGGPSNAVAIPFDEAASNVSDAIRQATNDAQIDLNQIKTVCLAMAGAGRESVRESWQQWSQDQALVHSVIVPDVSAVYAAGCKSKVGIAVISGTGSVVFGQNLESQFERVGGWGHLIGDEGSGFWITQQALKAVVQAEDGMAASTLLTAKFLEKLQVSSVKELAREAAQFDHRTWASWSSIVFQAAAEDTVAEDILRRAISHLSSGVIHVAKQLQLGHEFDFAIAGGVFVHNQSFQSRLITELRNQGVHPRCTLVEEPVNGAIEIAVQSVR